MKIRSFIKKFLLLLIEKITKKKIILVPKEYDYFLFENNSNKSVLPMLYNYQATLNNRVKYKMQNEGKELSYTLYTMASSQPHKWKRGQKCLSFKIPEIKPGDLIEVDLIEKIVWINEAIYKHILTYRNQVTRKYIADFRMVSDKIELARSCSHYLQYQNKRISKDYYFGDDYINYPYHTNPSNAVSLVKKYKTKGKLLDIGCALGIYTNEFSKAGFIAYGIDISSYAITEAKSKNHPDRFSQCNIDEEEIPFKISYDIFWLWDILEHVSNPLGLLEKITKKSASNSFLFLRTSNSDSLTHQILGSDWEGYSDYSHFGVDQVSATKLKKWMKDLGWHIIEWKCDSIWVEGTDPILKCLKLVIKKVPELRLLVSERNIGDSILMIAKRS